LRGAAAAVALAAVLWVAGLAAASFVVTGARLDLDADRGILRAWQVRITDGRRVVTAPELVLNRAAGVGVLSGGVRATGPEGELRSATARIRFTQTLELVAVEAEGQAQLSSRDGRLSARRVSVDTRRGVAVAVGSPAVLATGEVTATGSRMVYRTRQQEAEVGAPARFETRHGAVQGREAAFDLKTHTARLAGPVVFRFSAGRGEARQAVADFAAGRLELEGPVRMRWRGSTVEGRRAVVWYREGRVVVEGPSRMRVEEEDLPRIP